MDNQEKQNGKQLYQSKKEEKKARKEAERKQNERKQMLRKARSYSLILLVVVAIGFGLYILTVMTGPEGEDFSRSVPVMDDMSHIPNDQSETVEYTSDPPTSGPHSGQTARSGFRDEEIQDGNIIHNLEHGDIWISYHPDVSDEVKDQLRQFGAAKVIITPRSANDTDIALAAWGRLDTFDIEDGEVPIQRIEDFIKRYTGFGPERVPGASGGV